MSTVALSQPRPVSQTAWCLAYYAFYLAYLFLYREDERMHWVSLVGVPLLLLIVLHRSVADALASVGLRRDTLLKGLLPAVVIGLGISLLQGQTVITAFQKRSALTWFAVALGVGLLTAGFTEEFFFRGVLQTRLMSSLKTRWVAVLLCAFLFAVYHIPYTYYVWPVSRGDWGRALRFAMSDGMIGGLILGAIYARWKNLLACVVTHSLINAVPVMLMLQRRHP